MPTGTLYYQLTSPGPWNLNYTMGTNKYPSGSVSYSGGTWFQRSGLGSSGTWEWYLYLCKSDGSCAHQIGTISVNGSSNGYNSGSVTAVSLGTSATDLKGAALYVKCLFHRTFQYADPSTDAMQLRNSNCSITFGETTAITACTAPTSVTVASTTTNGQLKTTWAGAKAGTDNAISSYHVVWNTSKTTANAPYSRSVTSTGTSGNTTTATNSKTKYYTGVQTRGAAGSSYYSAYAWSSTSAAAIWPSSCGAPSVSLSRAKGVVTISWSGATSGTDNAISSYGIIRNTTATTTSATTISGTFTSTGTSGSTTNSPGAGTFYYGVRTQGAAGSSFYSGYTWTSITVPAKPTVTAGNKILKTDMDSLKTWLNGNQTAVTQNNIITETVGDTYGTTTSGNTVDASWYNGLT